jgi:hypothetical protein
LVGEGEIGRHRHIRNRALWSAAAIESVAVDLPVAVFALDVEFAEARVVTAGIVVSRDAAGAATLWAALAVGRGTFWIAPIGASARRHITPVAGDGWAAAEECSDRSDDNPLHESTVTRTSNLMRSHQIADDLLMRSHQIPARAKRSSVL